MNQIALVTGADHGLGFSLVEKLLSQNITVVAGRHVSNTGGLDELKKVYGDKLHIVSLDISSLESIKEAARYFEQNFDHLDILLNNAAILGDIQKTIFDEIDYDDILKTFSVNTLGPLKMVQVFLPWLLKGERKLIVNISSEAGSITTCRRKNWFGYTMSKAALNMESALLQNQLHENGIRIILFHPGWLRTWMNGKLDDRAPTMPEAAAERLLQRIEKAGQYSYDKPPFIHNDTGDILPW